MPRRKEELSIYGNLQLRADNDDSECDTIGLLKPIEYTESGYRLYDDTSLERLQQILLFKVFDTTKIDEYSKRVKEQWGQTSEYKEFEEKTKNWTKDDEATVANEFMQLFVEFGQMKEMDPEDEQVQLQVRKLQDYITDHFYTCSDKILCGLGRMYAGGGELPVWRIEKTEFTY